MTPSPKRPYFIRAMHEWLENNSFTAYILVDTTHESLVAPLQYANENRLVLAISYQATKDLFIDDTAISFNGRFGGVAQDVWIPMQAVLGIYAKEDTTHGIFFDPNEYDSYTPPTPPTNDTPKGGHLRFV